MLLDRWKHLGPERSGSDAQARPSIEKARHADTGPGRKTRLDVMRALAAEAATRVERASEAERAGVLIQLRALQDEIAHLKHRHPILGETPSGLAWVDAWSPSPDRRVP